MINTIKKLIQEFINLEQEVRTLNRDKSKKELYNSKLLEMEMYAVPEMKNTFGMLYKDAFYFDFDEVIEENKISNISPETQKLINNIDTTIQYRHLFKIEEYENNLFKVFLSVANPQGKSYGQCFIVKDIENNYIISAKYFLSRENPSNIKWVFNAGNRSIPFTQKKKPINVKRFLDPSDDVKSMELHN